MDRQPKRGQVPVIGVVEPVRRETVLALGEFDVVEYRADELQASKLRERRVALLVVGGSYQPLKAILPALRTSTPNLAVVAISDFLDRSSINFYRNHVDGLYELPKDADRLSSIIVHEAAVVPSGWISHVQERLASAISSIIVVVTLFGLWWAAVALFDPPSYLLPSPVAVALAFFSHLEQFLSHLSATAFEALLGFAIGNALGISIAVLLHRYVSLQRFTLPVLISLQAIPIVALAPLLVVWLGTGLISKVAMAAIICFLPIVVNTLQAFSSVDHEYTELFEFYRADFSARLSILLMPASFSAIVAALKISASLAVVGAIVAELTGADKGLGYILLNASYRLETDMMFVAMLLSGVLGMIFFQMPALLRLIVPRSWKVALT